MYDELERAYGERTRRGPSVLGWFLIGLATFFVVGVAGVGLAFYTIAGEVREFAEELEASDPVAAAVSGMLADVGPGVLAADPAVGRAILANLRSGDMDREELRDLVEGSLLLRTAEGDVTADLRGGEEGGSLVVRGPDGEVRIDLVRQGEGGELLVRADGETVRFGAGESADEAPSWVPRPGGMPAEVQRVFSAHSGEGLFGVASWESDAAPEELVEAYREGLARRGWLLRAEHSLRSGDARSMSVMGRDEGAERMVFLAASLEGDVTKVVLGWGEGVER